MKLKILGTGSKGNLYILEDNTEALILDCGISYKEAMKALNYNVSKIVGCVVTHEHGDHAKYASEFENAGIEVFKPYLGGNQNKKYGNFNIIAFPLPHDGVENRGFLIVHPLIGAFLYMTDMEFCKYTFAKYKPRNLLIEANYDKQYVDMDSAKAKHVIKGHCEIETALGIINSNATDSLKNVILCHLSEDNANGVDFTERTKKFVPESTRVLVANKGLEITL